MIEACHALRRENHEVIYASMIKDTMKRKKPSFDESYYGYRSFTHLLEDADNLALVDIERNPKSGTYMVTGICGEGEDRAPGTPVRRAGVPDQHSPMPGGTREDQATAVDQTGWQACCHFGPGHKTPALSFIFPRRDPIINCM